jgi:lysophospholipase L1-like esterase
VKTTAHPPPRDSQRLLRRLGWALAAGVLVFGLACEDWQSSAWAAVTVLVFALPLGLQWARSAAWRVYGLWFGLFMVLQSLISPLLQGNHVTLPPGMKARVDVRAADIPGYPAGLRQITTDEKGWRVQPPVNYGRKQGLRVIAIGGSTTEDILLDDKSTWTHRLQQDLAAEFPGLHVINTGVSGLRAVNHVATLQVAAPLQPDLVLLLLGGNDWNRQIRLHFEPKLEARPLLPFRMTALPRLVDGLVISPLRELMGHKRDWVDTSEQINSVQDFARGRKRYADRHPRLEYRATAVSAEYAAELVKLGTLCRDQALRCLFMTQPHAYGPPRPAPDMVAQFWMTPPYADYSLDLDTMARQAALYQQHLKAFAVATGHAVCDPAAGMPPERQLFYDDMHFTDAGAQRVAELVLPCVRNLLKTPRTP